MTQAGAQAPLHVARHCTDVRCEAHCGPGMPPMPARLTPDRRSARAPSSGPRLLAIAQRDACTRWPACNSCEAASSAGRQRAQPLKRPRRLALPPVASAVGAESMTGETTPSRRGPPPRIRKEFVAPGHLRQQGFPGRRGSLRCSSAQKTIACSRCAPRWPRPLQRERSRRARRWRARPCREPRSTKARGEDRPERQPVGQLAGEMDRLDPPHSAGPISQARGGGRQARGPAGNESGTDTTARRAARRRRAVRTPEARDVGAGWRYRARFEQRCGISTLCRQSRTLPLAPRYRQGGQGPLAKANGCRISKAQQRQKSGMTQINPMKVEWVSRRRARTGA